MRQLVINNGQNSPFKVRPAVGVNCPARQHTSQREEPFLRDHNKTSNLTHSKTAHRDQTLHLEGKKQFLDGENGFAPAVARPTLADSLPVLMTLAEDKPHIDKYPQRAGNAITEETITNYVHRMFGDEIIIVTAAPTQIPKLLQINSNPSQLDLQSFQERNKSGIQQLQQSNPSPVLRARIVFEETLLNNSRFLPYEQLCSPVFSLKYTRKIHIMSIC